MIRTRSLVVLALAVFVPACDGEDDKGGDAKDEDSNAPTPAADRTPLKRRDAPPAGVAEQVSYFSVGNGGCPEGDQPAVRFLGGFPREGQESIGQQFVICLSGFAKGRPVRVSVRRPDGRRRGLAGRNRAGLWASYAVMDPTARRSAWPPRRHGNAGSHDGPGRFSVRRSAILACAHWRTTFRPEDRCARPRRVRIEELVALHLYRARGGSSETLLLSHDYQRSNGPPWRGALPVPYRPRRSANHIPRAVQQASPGYVQPR